MMQITVADLFCGCGGFSYGFQKSEIFKPILAVDHWDQARTTYTSNYPGVEFLLRDLHVKASQDEVIGRLKDKCDILVGGPPCQGFSTLGKRDANDKRSNLVEVFVKMALSIRPKFIFMENVRGITTMPHPKYKTFGDFVTIKIGDECSEYYVYANHVNALDHGAPQNRIRWLVFAVRKDITNSFTIFHNIKKHIFHRTVKSPKNLRDAISNLPLINSGEGADEINITRKGRVIKKIYNHKAMKHSPKLLERIAHVPKGGGLLDVPRYLLTEHLKKMVDGKYGSGGHVKNIYGRMDWDQPSGTIVAGIDKITCGRYFHPDQHRMITPRECARIQTFPDTFRFYGGQVTQYYLIGNAVPPIISIKIAKALLKEIKK
jgi:DNA-cytosine methyltransferase